MPDLKNFHTQEVELPQQKTFSLEHYNGRNYNTTVWSQYVLFPQQSGKIEIPAITFEGVIAQQVASDDPFDAFFNGGSNYVEVKKNIVTPKLTINVKALPDGKPINFSGGVGEFTISTSISTKELKTNAMRILDRNKIPYEYETYECDEFVDGITTADKIGLPHEQVYKTLVTVGKTGGHYVFVIPIAAELDLKKAAKSVGEKSVEMLHVKDITAVTGYVRGGCTAIGMKKQFPTVIDSSAQHQEYIYVSGGKIGMQIKLKPDDLKKAARAEYGEITF